MEWEDRKGNSICTELLALREWLGASPDTDHYLKVGLIISILHLRKRLREVKKLAHSDPVKLVVEAR